MGKTVWLITALLCMHIILYAQLQTPYILNGTATQRTCNCYVLTEDIGNSSGTVWNKNKIDLNNSFDYYFDVNLGCKDDTGADGIAFVLQTQGTNLGSTGQGIGFKGISPSLGVIIDTWQNDDENDPSFDHLAIQMNGVADHLSLNNLAGPVTALDGSDNIEDCNWHIFRIKWDATAKQMDVSMDGVPRLSLQKDLVKDIFNNSPLVYWGFGAGTGGSSNKQQFCAALRPQLEFDNSQLFCDGTPVTFGDNSKSFGTITRWLWDFGDGTTSTVPQPPPHQYAKPGGYLVTMVIEDNSGCVSDTMKQQVTIGTYPVADFSMPVLCTGKQLPFKDETTLSVGSLAYWNWDFGNGQTSDTKDPVVTYSATGSYDIHLQVTSKEGCTDEIQKTSQAYATPAVNATGENACLGFPVQFTGTDLTPAIALQEWHWDLGNGTIVSSQLLNYTYPAGGNYQASLYTISTDNCLSNTVVIPVSISDLHVNAGRDTLIANGQPLQLNAVANGDDLLYSWFPQNGLDNSLSSHPMAYLQADQTYYLTVTSSEGCIDKDTLNVKVYKGPEFYVPTAFSPNSDGRNDVFHAISPGVTALDFFCVWSRWGQEIFRTQSLTTGWDGSFKGIPSEAGTYVWMIQGKDYLGRTFSRKGTVILVR
jgi:gliding motility-associated-like protein